MGFDISFKTAMVSIATAVVLALASALIFMVLESRLMASLENAAGQGAVSAPVGQTQGGISSRATSAGNRFLQAAIRQRLRWFLLGELAVILTGLGIWLAVVLAYQRKILTRPLEDCIDFCRFLSKGDFTRRLPVSGEDEINRLARGLNAMAEGLDGIFQGILVDIETLSFSSIELSAIARQLLAGVEQTSKRSGSANRAVGHAAVNIRNMADSAQQVSGQISRVVASSAGVSRNMAAIETETRNVSAAVNAVDDAIRSISGTLAKISKNSGETARVTHNASEQAAATSRVMHDLGDAVDEVSNIVTLINNIALDSNILALNASIQATAAGRYGRGFAVVSSEIKKLAMQTAEATDVIRDRIDGMQTNTRRAVEAIQNIVDVISTIDGLMKAIAEAIEQQTLTIDQISENVATTAIATRTVSDNVREAVAMDREVSKRLDTGARAAEIIARDAGEASGETDKAARDVGEVDQTAELTARGARQIRSQAEHLAELSKQLQIVFGRFKTKDA